jgi:hypothetical protein
MDRLLCRQTLTSWLPAIGGWTWGLIVKPTR